MALTQILRTQLARHRAGHRDQRAFAGDIGHQARRAPQRSVRRHVDDFGVRVACQQRHRRLTHKPGAAHVDLHHPIPQVDIVFHHGFATDAGRQRRVVHQAVDPPPAAIFSNAERIESGDARSIVCVST